MAIRQPYFASLIKEDHRKLHLTKPMLELKKKKLELKFVFFFLGGRESKPGKWPWQVAIRNVWHETFCGGTIVAPGWVLTAAHCIRKRLFVLLGEHDLVIHEVRMSFLVFFLCLVLAQVPKCFVLVQIF